MTHPSRFLASTLAAALLAVSAGCSRDTVTTGPGAGEVGLGEAFTLAPGQHVTIRETQTRVGFGSVLEDSRCPIDALILCVWSGNARVRVWMWPERVGPTDDVAEFDLNTGLDPRYRDAGTLRVTLEAVSPGPQIERPPPGAYRATLRVTLLP